MLGQGPAGVTTGTTVCFFSKISFLWEPYTKKQHFKISLSLSVNFDGKVIK